MSSFWTNAVVRQGQIWIRGVEDGVRFQKKLDYRPTLYSQVEQRTPGNLSTIYGQPVKPIEFGSIKEARDSLKNNPERLFGYDRFNYVYLAEQYPGQVEFDPALIKIGIIDIETMADEGMPKIETAKAAVTAITYKVDGRIFVFGCREYQPSNSDVIYRHCADEADLLRQFLGVWSSPDFCPDIITGWYIELFDIPYLVNRITNVLGPAAAKKLSPWRTFTQQTIMTYGEEHVVEFPLGISVLDYKRLYHKLAVMTRAAETPDDYKLNTVAAAEVDEKKLDYSEYEGLHDLYVRDHQKYIDYNIHDVLLVEKIDDKRQLIDLVIAMAYNAKVNFEDMLGSVRAWECIIHHKLLSQGIVLPPRRQNKKEVLIGAFVKEPPTAGFDWVVSFDLNSLYSHLIMQWNISPETRFGKLSRDLAVDQILNGELQAFAKELKDKNGIVSANMMLFDRRRKGYLPAILFDMYNERKKAKASANQAKKDFEATKDPVFKRLIAKWNNMDKVHKTNLNAAYGVLTNQYFLFYDHPNAEAITMSGQLAIKWIEKAINIFVNRMCGTEGKDYVITMDTDSAYINMGPLVEKMMPGRTKAEITEFMVRLCGPCFDSASNPVSTPMEEMIDKAYQELADLVNAVEQKMVMKRETIADRGIWTGGKNYILNTLDEEGVRFKEPKIVLKGVAAVKSSTPPACRVKLKQAVKLIMTGTQKDMMGFVEDFRKEFETLSFHEIASPRTVSDIEKYSDAVSLYKSATPIQVRAAILYNKFVRDSGLTQFPLAYNDDKIKYAYIKKPNLLKENVFGTPGPIPPGIDIDKLMDRDLMFEKGFLMPLKTMLDAIDWSVVDEGESLEQFFV